MIPKWDEVETSTLCLQMKNLFFENGITIGEMCEMLDEAGEEWKISDGSDSYTNISLDDIPNGSGTISTINQRLRLKIEGTFLTFFT